MAAPYPQVVLFGDSLFEGAAEHFDGFSLQGALQARYMRRYDVVNRGFSGYNTSQALQALPDIFPQPLPESNFTPKIAFFLVLLGANDAMLPAPQDTQHVPLEEYEANLTAILTHPNIQAHKPTKILVVTPPPLDGILIGEIERADGQTSRSRRAPVSAQYSAAARRVAKSLSASMPHIVLVDLHKALMDLAIARTPGFDPFSGVILGDEDAPGSQRGYLANLLTDGLHLSGEGYRVLFELLHPHIGPQSSRDTPEDWAFPDWSVAPWLNK